MAIFKYGTGGRDDFREVSDPLASQIEWKPLASGGANFKTAVLVEVGGSRVEIRRSVGMWIFSVGFTALGLGAVIAGVIAMGFPGNLLFGGVGLLFAVIGGIMFARSQPFTFDRKTGQFGRKRLSSGLVPASLGRLSDIHALQLLQERVSSSDGPDYDSFETNLVLHEGRRVHVSDQGNLRAARRDAERLASFLGVDIWDATTRSK